jgi:hypothetical protein
VLAACLEDPIQIAVTASAVHFMTQGEHGTISRMGLDGANRKTIVSTRYPEALTASSDRLYWLAPGFSSGAVFSCQASACDAGSFATAGLPSSLYVAQSSSADDGVYWTESVGPGAMPGIYKCPLGSQCPAPVTISDAQAFWMASDPATIYFTNLNTGGVYAMPSGGGDAATIAEAMSPTAVLVDRNGPGTYVYWLHAGGISSCAEPCTTPSNVVCDIDGAPSPDEHVYAMAMAPEGLVYTSGNDRFSASVKMVPRNSLHFGCANNAVQLAAGQPQPVAIVTSNGYAYWVNQGLLSTPGSGSVVRVKLP